MTLVSNPYANKPRDQRQCGRHITTTTVVVRELTAIAGAAAAAIHRGPTRREKHR